MQELKSVLLQQTSSSSQSSRHAGDIKVKKHRNRAVKSSSWKTKKIKCPRFNNALINVLISSDFIECWYNLVSHDLEVANES